MAAANKSYKGGLVFYGRSTTGKIFSSPVAYNVNALNNQVDINLDFGTWTFAAVSWDGGGGANQKTFEGASTCALMKDVKIDTNQATINLTLSSATCGDAEFGQNSPGTFKTIGIVTCGTLWKNLTPTLLNSDDPSFCNSGAALPPDFKTWAGAAYISVPILPAPVNKNESLLVQCITLTEGKNLSTSKFLPEKGLPIRIELSKEDCTQPKEIIASYDFDRGINKDYSASFDKLYFPGSSSYNLYVLNTKSQRGISSLLDSMPSFQCDSSNPCIKMPKSFAKYVEPDRYFYVKDFQQGDACSNIIPSNDSAVPGDISLAGFPISDFDNTKDCEQRDGRFYIRLKSDQFDNSCSASPGCVLSVNLNSTATIYDIRRSPSTLDDISALSAYDLIFRALGHEDTILNQLSVDSKIAYDSFNIFHEDNEEEEYFGMLSHIRQMFAPDAIGGLLYNVTESTLAGKDFNFSIWDDGTPKPFNIKVESNSETIPTYINVGATKYTHKLTISRIQGGAKTPFQIIRWAYGKKIGMSEMKFVEVDTDKNEKRTNRNLFYWNTESIDDSRFEIYGSEEVNVNTNPSIVKLRRTSFVRAEREPTAGQGNARIDQYSYESRKEGTVYNERGSKQSIQLNDSIALFKESQANFNNATSSGNYFNQDYFKQFNQSEAPSNNVSFAVSPDGTQKVWAWSEYLSGYWNLRVALKLGLNAPVSFFKFDSSASQPILPKLSINNGGQVGIAWVVEYSTSAYDTFAVIYSGIPVTLNDNTTTTVWGWIDTTSSTALSVDGETISAINPIAGTYSDKVVIDIVDDDPTANDSDKFVVYSKPIIGFTTSWNIDFKAWNSTLSTVNKWTNPLQLMDLSLNIPYEIHFSKANNNNYYLTYFYTFLDGSNGTITEFTTGKVTNQGVSNYFGSGNVNSASPKTIPNGVSLVTSSFNPSTGSMELFLSNNNQYTFSSSGSLSGPTSLGANYIADFDHQTYCFDRSKTSSKDLGDTNKFANDPDCMELETSYDPPIKSDFKFNIETLKPSIFNTIFTPNF
jgi:hypothetical protein